MQAVQDLDNEELLGAPFQKRALQECCHCYCHDSALFARYTCSGQKITARHSIHGATRREASQNLNPQK